MTLEPGSPPQSRGLQRENRRRSSETWRAGPCELFTTTSPADREHDRIPPGGLDQSWPLLASDANYIDAAPASPTGELSTIFEGEVAPVVSTARHRKSPLTTPVFDSAHTMTPHWSALIAPIRHLLFYRYVFFFFIALSYYLHCYHLRPIARARRETLKEQVADQCDRCDHCGR